MDPSQNTTEGQGQQAPAQVRPQESTQAQDQHPSTQPAEQPQLLTDEQITARCNVLIEDINMQIFIMNEAAESLAHYKAVHSEVDGMINSIQDHLAVLAEIDPTPHEDIEYFMNQAYLFDKVMAKSREWSYAINELGDRTISWHAKDDADYERRENPGRGRTDRGLKGGAWEYAEMLRVSLKGDNMEYLLPGQEPE
ncbi:hypothetical protein GE09DRAFT_1222316 [Coniochaeta sp. 2T2.1]|nr:hypothetical protein GE09DRAFT_1222316 [Coniochaeta sp. 2T2.1]